MGQSNNKQTNNNKTNNNPLTEDVRKKIEELFVSLVNLTVLQMHFRYGECSDKLDKLDKIGDCCRNAHLIERKIFEDIGITYGDYPFHKLNIKIGETFGKTAMQDRETVLLEMFQNLPFLFIKKSHIFNGLIEKETFYRYLSSLARHFGNTVDSWYETEIISQSTQEKLKLFMETEFEGYEQIKFLSTDCSPSPAEIEKIGRSFLIMQFKDSCLTRYTTKEGEIVTVSITEEKINEVTGMMDMIKDIQDKHSRPVNDPHCYRNIDLSYFIVEKFQCIEKWIGSQCIKQDPVLSKSLLPRLLDGDFKIKKADMRNAYNYFYFPHYLPNTETPIRKEMAETMLSIRKAGPVNNPGFFNMRLLPKPVLLHILDYAATENNDAWKENSFKFG